VYGSTEAEEDPGATTGMIGWGLGAGARSLTRILLRRVLLMLTDGSMDRSTERSNFKSLRSRIMSIPNGKCRFEIRRYSESMKLMMSLGMFTLIPFKRQ